MCFKYEGSKEIIWRGEYHEIIQFLVMANGVPMNLYYRITVESLNHS